MAGKASEKDATRLLQGMALVVSRMVELQSAQSAGSAAESRWSNAARASGNGFAVRSIASHKPQGAFDGTVSDPAGHVALVAALASEQQARVQAEDRITALIREKEALRMRLAEAEQSLLRRSSQESGVTRDVRPKHAAEGEGSASHLEHVEAHAATSHSVPGGVAQGATQGEREPERPSVRACESPAEDLASAGASVQPTVSHAPPTTSAPPRAPAAAAPRARQSRESSVPTNPFMRIAQFGALGMGMGMGVLGEAVKRTLDGTVTSGGGLKGMVLSSGNSDRLTATLCRMRGAALKLGQLLSIQDEHVIPKDSPLRAVIDRVREEAENMPPRQLYKVLADELGSDWRSKFKDFDHTPMAAASIGQVHRAVTHEGVEVCVKVQYPGVADSIDADIGTLSTMLSPLAPKGMFLKTALTELKGAMKAECDYIQEAKMTHVMREMLAGDPTFGVPRVFPELSSKKVITTERMHGVPIDQVSSLDQETRDRVAMGMMKLTLLELFELHTMQTDPNWSNFLYDEMEGKINLIDFGAAVEYDKDFCINYGRLVRAASAQDRQGVLDISLKMGFLTGKESGEFLDAHTAAAFITGEPFRGGKYDFGTCRMTERNGEHIATMLSQRLTAPPRPVYTLHRKLSGAFLSCMRLRANIETRPVFEETFLSKNYD